MALADEMIRAWLAEGRPATWPLDNLADTAAGVARTEINRLRDEVARLGDMAEVCTFSVLDEVCEYCRCERRASHS